MIELSSPKAEGCVHETLAGGELWLLGGLGRVLGQDVAAPGRFPIAGVELNRTAPGWAACRYMREGFRESRIIFYL